MEKANSIIVVLLPLQLGRDKISQTVTNFEAGLKSHAAIQQSFAVKSSLDQFGSPVVENYDGEITLPPHLVSRLQLDVSQAYQQYRNATDASTRQRRHAPMAALKLAVEQATCDLASKKLYVFSDVCGKPAFPAIVPDVARTAPRRPAQR